MKEDFHSAFGLKVKKTLHALYRRSWLWSAGLVWLRWRFLLVLEVLQLIASVLATWSHPPCSSFGLRMLSWLGFCVGRREVSWGYFFFFNIWDESGKFLLAVGVRGWDTRGQMGLGCFGAVVCCLKPSWCDGSLLPNVGSTLLPALPQLPALACPFWHKDYNLTH